MCVSVALCLHLRSHTPDSAAGSHSYLPAFPPVTGRCCPGATERVWRRRHSGTVCPVLLRCGVSLSSVPGGQRSPVFYERVRKELFATLSLIRLLLLLLLPLLLSYAALCSLLSVTCSLVRLLARTPRARGGPRFRFQKCFRPPSSCHLGVGWPRRPSEFGAIGVLDVDIPGSRGRLSLVEGDQGPVGGHCIRPLKGGISSVRG